MRNRILTTSLLALLVAGCGGGAESATTATTVPGAPGAIAIESCDQAPAEMEQIVGLLMAELGDQAVGNQEDAAANLVVFVDESADPAALAADASGRPGVMSTRVVTQEEAVAEFFEMFADEPEMLAVIEENPAVVPASLRLFVDFPLVAAEAAQFDGIAGVTGVETWDASLILQSADRILSPLASAIALRNLLVVIGDLECSSVEVSGGGAAFEVTPPGPAAAVVLEALRLGFTP